MFARRDAHGANAYTAERSSSRAFRFRAGGSSDSPSEVKLLARDSCASLSVSPLDSAAI